MGHPPAPRRCEWGTTQPSGVSSGLNLGRGSPGTDLSASVSTVGPVSGHTYTSTSPGVTGCLRVDYKGRKTFPEGVGNSGKTRVSMLTQVGVGDGKAKVLSGGTQRTTRPYETATGDGPYRAGVTVPPGHHRGTSESKTVLPDSTPTRPRYPEDVLPSVLKSPGYYYQIFVSPSPVLF